MIGLVLGSILVFATIFLIVAKRTNLDPIGAKEFDLVDMYTKGEAARFYIEQSAKYSIAPSIFTLSQNGGFYDLGACGKSLGYNLWYKDKDCYPKADLELSKQFSVTLGQYTLTYSGILPVDYAVSVLLPDPLTLMASSSDTIKIGSANTPITSAKKTVITRLTSVITGEKLPDKTGPPPTSIPRLDSQRIPYIYTMFAATIRRYLIQYPTVSPSLIMGIIYRESRGNPNLVSGTGCVGLTGMCYPTATGKLLTPSIFSKSRLVPCKCNGNQCLSQATRACSPENDDRFNPDKDIEASIVYYSWLQNLFPDSPIKQELAVASYNVGIGVIKKAVANTNVKNPSWEQVMGAITPEVLASFDDYKNWDTKALQGKVSEVRKYVADFKALQNKFDLLIQNDAQTVYAQEKATIPVETHDCCLCQGRCGLSCVIQPVEKSLSCSGLVGRGIMCTFDPFCTPKQEVYQTAQYELKPVVTVSYNYSLNDYSKLQQLTSSVIIPALKDCVSAKTLSECVKPVLAIANEKDSQFSWSYNSFCDAKNEVVLYRFFEDYQECAESKDDNCICDFGINGENNPEGTYDVNVVDKGDSTEFTQEIGIAPLLSLPTRTYLLKPGNPASVKYSFKFYNGNVQKASVDSTELKNLDPSHIRMQKNNNALTLFYDDSTVPSLPKCDMKKKSVRLCAKKIVNSKPVQIPIVNAKGSPEPKELVYKFAVSIS